MSDLPVMRVDDAADPRLDGFRALNDAAARRAIEAPAPAAPHGRFVVEGTLPLATVLASPHASAVRAVLVAAPRLTAVRASGLLDAAVRAGTTVLTAEAAVVDAACGFPLHRGVVSVADRWPWPPAAEVVAGARCLLVLEESNDAENLGALFRNAAALGADGLLLGPRCGDPFYRRTVRVAVGHVATVPFARVTPWPGGLDALAAAGVSLIALTPDLDAPPLATIAERRPARVALLLGAEGPGLSASALAHSTERARIPMRPGVDSLNVATAAAVALSAFSQLE